MENLRFQEIKIRVDPERYKLLISARGKKAAVPLSTLRLTKTNEIIFNRQGEIFMAMANGNFNPKLKGTDNAIGRLSHSLRDAFDTNDPPFLKHAPQFLLTIPKDNAAKQRAIRNSHSYDDNKMVDVNNNAGTFLQDNDPEYDLDNPIYSDDLD